MKQSLINQILATGKQFPEKKLQELTTKNLEFILFLRKKNVASKQGGLIK